MKLLFALAVLVLTSCLNYENNVNLNYDEMVQIKAQALVSLVTEQNFTPEIWVQPGDTVVLMGNILPTRNVKLRTSFWSIDENFNASSLYLVKWVFTEPGRHLNIFNALDVHGDTLRDTAVVWVGYPPDLIGPYFPADNSAGIPYKAQDKIIFHWGNNSDKNPIYRFNLVESLSNRTIIDTTISHNYLEFNQDLKAQTAYQWKVLAQDSWGLQSTNSQWRTFFTQGYNREAWLRLKTNREHLSAPAPPLFATLHNEHDTLRYQITPGVFEELNFIKPGYYTLTIFDSLLPEYATWKSSINFKPHSITTLNPTLFDAIPPRIRCLDCRGDTVALSPNMLFKVEDFGSGSVAINSCRLNSTPIECALVESSDTLRVMQPHWEIWSGVYQLILEASDAAGNTNSTTFWVQQ